MEPIIAYHLIMTAYGFWLPNDPRGSWSDVVRAWELLLFGEATKVTTKRSLARKAHDRQLRLAAKAALVRDPVEFSGLQARAVARGFADYCARSGLIVYACSILPTHAHLVIARHSCSIEQVARLLKGAATTQLKREGLHPFKDEPYSNGQLPSPWTRHEWSVFLHNNEEILRAIRYVLNNPLKEGLKPQDWSCVTAFAG
jgi:hypothetical protein